MAAISPCRSPSALRTVVGPVVGAGSPAKGGQGETEREKPRGWGKQVAHARVHCSSKVEMNSVSVCFTIHWLFGAFHASFVCIAS